MQERKGEPFAGRSCIFLSSLLNSEKGFWGKFEHAAIGSRDLLSGSIPEGSAGRSLSGAEARRLQSKIE